MANVVTSSPDGASRRVSFQAHMLSLWAGEYFPKMVLIPAAIGHAMIHYDFKTVVETRTELSGMSEESLNAMLNFIYTYHGLINDPEIDTIIERSLLPKLDGLVPGDVNMKVSLVTNLMRELLRSTSQSGLASIFLRESLTANINRYEFSTGFVTYTALNEVVRGFQNTYSRLCEQAQTAELASVLTSEISRLPILKFVHALRRSVDGAGAPPIPARLDYVIDNISKATFGDESLVNTEEVLEGIEYKVKPADWITNENYGFSDLLVAYVQQVRFFMGFEVSNTTSVLDAKELLEEFISKQVQLPPGVTQEIYSKGKGNKVLDKMFPRFWLMFIIQRATSNVPSIMGSRAKGLITEKYRDSEYRSVAEYALDTYGLAVDAWMDAVKYIEKMYLDERLLFTDIHHLDRPIHKKFTDDLFKPYITFGVPLTSPRYAREGAHLLTHSVSLMTKDLTPIMTSQDKRITNGFRFLKDDSFLVEYRNSPIIQGNLFEVSGLPDKREIFAQMTSKQRVHYFIQLQNNNLLTEFDLFKNMLSIIPHDKLIKKSRFYKEHLKNGRLEVVYSKSDFAQLMRLPDVVATKLYHANEHIYWVANSVNSAMYVAETDDCLMYDIVQYQDQRRLKDFIAEHPTFFVLSNEPGVDINTTIKTDLPVNVEISASKPSTRITTKKETIETNGNDEEMPEQTPEKDVSFKDELKPAQKPKGKDVHKKSAPTEKPPVGTEWVYDKDLGEWVAKPKNGKAGEPETK